MEITDGTLEKWWREQKNHAKEGDWKKKRAKKNWREKKRFQQGELQVLSDLYPPVSHFILQF